MIAIIDYGMGNLFSVKNALEFLDIPCFIAKDKCELNDAQAFILPGVGAFPAAMEKLKSGGMQDAILKECEKKPLLGICLGMQMLFSCGYEFEKTDGLNLISGDIVPIKTNLKVPHMGYNQLLINPELKNLPLLCDVNNGDNVYFVHSFMADTKSENVSAFCDYNVKIPAIVQNGNIFGTQFHPEKSGKVGLTILKNFAKLSN